MKMNVFFIIVCSFFVGLMAGRWDALSVSGLILNIVAVAINTANLFGFSAKEWAGQVSHD